jgi:hypothetical protein
MEKPGLEGLTITRLHGVLNSCIRECMRVLQPKKLLIKYTLLPSSWTPQDN